MDRIILLDWVFRLIYLISSAFLMIPAVTAASISLQVRGIWVPWVTKSISEGTRMYRADPLAVTLMGLVISIVFSYYVGAKVSETGRKVYYLYGLILIVLVITVAALALYGEACATCPSKVCGLGNVHRCGILWRNLFEVAIECICAG